MILTLILTSVIAVLFVFIVMLLRFKTNQEVIRKHSYPYIFNSENKSVEKQTAVLFGYNRYFLATNFGSDVPVTVNPDAANVSYIEALNNSAGNPFTVRTIRIKGSFRDVSELVINAFDKNPYTGSETCNPIRVSNYLKTENGKQLFESTDNISVDIDCDIPINGNSCFKYEMNSNSKVKIFLFYNTSQMMQFRLGKFLYMKFKMIFSKDKPVFFK